MKKKTGKEMRNLMVTVSVTTLLLVLAVIAYFMIDVIVTTNGNIEDNKQKVIDQSAQSLTQISNNINSMVTNPATLQLFNQELIRGARRNEELGPHQRPDNPDRHGLLSHRV